MKDEEESVVRFIVHPSRFNRTKEVRFSPRRLWAYARREATEIRRDPIRLAFALLAPLV